jgi:hypothetical protein
MKKNIMQKVKEEQKVFHSFKELQEEWQRQGIVKPGGESEKDKRIKNFEIYSNKVDEMFRLVSGDK